MMGCHNSFSQNKPLILLSSLIWLLFLSSVEEMSPMRRHTREPDWW
jgi:hypothetical protein